MLDRVDRALRNAFLQRLRLVRDPFELAVHLARRDEDRDLADAWRDAGLEAKLAIDRAQQAPVPRAVEVDPRRAVQSDEARARARSVVIDLPARLVEVLAFGQRQAKAGLRIDVGGPGGGRLLRRGGRCAECEWHRSGEKQRNAHLILPPVT